jgi:hypothetical protein
MRLVSNDYKFWDTIQTIVNQIIFTFNRLSGNTRNLLFEMADNVVTASTAAGVITENFDMLPENVRNELLLKLADNVNASRDVADAVAKYDME